MLTTPQGVGEISGAYNRGLALQHHAPASELQAYIPKHAACLGPAPAYFSEPEKAIWDELIVIAPPGILTSADRVGFEIVARLLYEFRTNLDMGAGRMGHLRMMLQSLGMAPLERQRLVLLVPEPEHTDPLDEFC